MADDLLDDMRGELGTGPVRDRLTEDISTQEGLRRIFSELLHDGLAIMHASGKFAEVDPEEDSWEPPEDWVERAGGNREQATQAWRVARYALMPSNKAPIGLKLNQERTIGILLNQARNIDERKRLLVHQVEMPAITTTYRVVKDDDGKRR